MPVRFCRRQIVQCEQRVKRAVILILTWEPSRLCDPQYSNWQVWISTMSLFSRLCFILNVTNTVALHRDVFLSLCAFRFPLITVVNNDSPPNTYA